MHSTETKTAQDIRKLGDLRALLVSLEGWGDDSNVTLKESKTYSPTDRDLATITVTRTVKG